MNLTTKALETHIDVARRTFLSNGNYQITLDIAKLAKAVAKSVEFHEDFEAQRKLTLNIRRVNGETYCECIKDYTTKEERGDGSYGDYCWKCYKYKKNG